MKKHLIKFSIAIAVVFAAFVTFSFAPPQTMALLTADQTNRAIATSLKAQFQTDSKPTAINPANLAWGNSDLLNFVAIGADEFNSMLFFNIIESTYDDPGTGGLTRSFLLSQLLNQISTYYTGISSTPTFSNSVIPLGRKCTLVTGGGTVEEVNTNDASAFAEAFLTARSNGWITPN